MRVRVCVRGQITEVERGATIYMCVRVRARAWAKGRGGEVRPVCYVWACADMYGRVFVCDYIYIWACMYVRTTRGDEGARVFFDIIY